MSQKITSPGELKALRDKALSEIELREGAKEMRLTIHMGTCGIAAGAREILRALMDEIGEAGVTNVTLQQTGCAGLCDKEPMLTLVDKSGAAYRYGKLDKSKARRIVEEHVIRGNPVMDCLLRD